ncbi:Protoheme IX farnesyltransferase [Candidatus Hartigia pinicola]|nr:Protoheme IX farnesyltransferase [Candidatus Hartigia pinicola]
MFKQYLQITKPGIIFGNAISLIGGFLLASKDVIDCSLFIITVLSTSLIVASGCVFNNYIDRDIDYIMERTKNRPLVKGFLDLKITLIYASVLGVIGTLLLFIVTNALIVLLAIIGFFIYVVVYSLCMKRTSVYGTLIGSLSGGTLPVIGYCAVTNQFDSGAFILLFIFSLWQIPHSYAIAIFRFQDYKKANIPILPVIKGIFITKTHIILYILAFIIAVFMLFINGYAGYKYLIITETINFVWLVIAASGFKNHNDDHVWSRNLFLFSLVTITSLSIMISIDSTISTNTLM